MATPLRRPGAEAAPARAAREEIERFSNDYLQMEQWRMRPRDLLAGRERIIAQSGDGGIESRSRATGREPADAAGDPSPAGAAARAKPYLPANEAEELPQYRFRRDHLTVLDPDFDDAVDGVVGAMLPKPVTLDADGLSAEAQATVEAWRGNVDRAGRNLDSFLKALAADQVAEAASYIWVDARPDGTPYFSHWKGSSVPFIDQGRDEQTGDMVLEEVRATETKTIDGETRQVWRIYRRGNPAVPMEGVQREAIAAAIRGEVDMPAGASRYVTFETWLLDQEAGDGEEYELIGRGVLLPPNGMMDRPEFSEIPLYGAFSGWLRPHFARPRFLKLADMCILKLVKGSNLEAYLYWSGVPIDVIKGMTRKQWEQHNERSEGVIGGGHMNFISAEADWRKIEPTGASAGALQASKAELQQRIDRAAWATMMRQASGAELTATEILAGENRRATRLDVDASFLGTALQQATDRASLYWGGISVPVSMPPTDPSAIADPSQALEYIKLGIASEKLSAKSYIEIGHIKGWLPQEIDADEEAQRIADEAVG